MSARVRRWGRAAVLLLTLGVWPVATATSCTSAWVGSIGANLAQSKTDTRLTVREAPRELAAFKAGLREGDEIVSIDGRTTETMSPDDVHRALMGRVGTKVTLMVKRDGGTLRFEVERSPYVSK